MLYWTQPHKLHSICRGIENREGINLHMHTHTHIPTEREEQFTKYVTRE